jgi:predicted TIM-barrel fold metal-dependent hydrolase
MPPLEPARAVDCHAHVFSETAAAVPGARYRPAYGAALDGWRALWPRAGVTHGVLVQPSFFGTDNSEMLAALSSDREHLRGVAVLDPWVDAATIDRLHAGGVRAMRLNLRGAPDYARFAAASWRELYARVHARGWHVEVYVDTGRLPEVERAFGDAPARLVLDHFGDPGARDGAATFAAVERLAASREVWCKLSGPYRLAGGTARDLAARWLDAVGPARLVWGSDWPWTRFEAAADYQRLRESLDGWIDAGLTRAVLWDNAARLYQFD